MTAELSGCAGTAGRRAPIGSANTEEGTGQPLRSESRVRSKRFVCMVHPEVTRRRVACLIFPPFFFKFI